MRPLFRTKPPVTKEAFAREVLDRYFSGTRELVKQALDDKSLSPRQRLRRYPDIITGNAADRNWNLGCLIGDFSLETASHSELRRLRLEAIFQEWRTPFAACIAEAPYTGELNLPLIRLNSPNPPGFLGGNYPPDDGRTQPRCARSF
ncbi:MAG TPA: TetR family transcriptional regulator C-terminal domain-containing protein [Chthoniobacterales bacterium]